MFTGRAIREEAVRQRAAGFKPSVVMAYYRDDAAVYFRCCRPEASQTVPDWMERPHTFVRRWCPKCGQTSEEWSMFGVEGDDRMYCRCPCGAMFVDEVPMSEPMDGIEKQSVVERE